jgi:endonuclease YncB( thermonuclease family)
MPAVERSGVPGIGRILSFLALMLASVAGTNAQAQQGSSAGCALQVVGTATVTEVLDGRSFVLEDGREVRLPNLEVPLLGPSRQTDAQEGTAAATRDALQSLLAGQSVELRQMRAASDRYGRVIADAYIVQNGVRSSVAEEMVARGFARVSIQGSHAACAAQFFAKEETARRAKLGLWADPYYALVRAESFRDLLDRRGHFTVVEGTVISVRESAGTIYVNFGRRWSEALTVTIAKRSERNLVAAGLNPRNLENLRVRVRGWVEERNGPRIEVSRPEQIEIAER